MYLNNSHTSEDFKLMLHGTDSSQSSLARRVIIPPTLINHSGAPLRPKAAKAEHHTYISMRVNFDGHDVTRPYDGVPRPILHVKCLNSLSSHARKWPSSSPELRGFFKLRLL